MERTDVEFDYFLADRLGMTVADLRRRMSADEWLGWNIWHAKQKQAEQLASMRAG